jgi:TRAP-type C4-dicarboxylate transport system permease large subunit
VVAALALYSSAIGVRHRLERSPFDLRSAARALWQGKWEAALLPVLVAGLATGMLRIHEAAAFTALYVLLVELFVYRDITVRDVPRIAIDCVVLPRTVR